jgi:hypothetical protein
MTLTTADSKYFLGVLSATRKLSLAAMRMKSRVTGHVVLVKFHLYDNGVYQALDEPLALENDSAEDNP